MPSRLSSPSVADETPSLEEIRALAEFRYALRQFLRFSEEAASAAGVSPHQHQALLAIKGFRGSDGMSIGELAERLQIRHHSAVELVDRLVLAGLVSRAAAAHDRRKVLVGLNAAGEDVLGRLAVAHRQELRRTGPVLRDLLERLDAPADR